MHDYTRHLALVRSIIISGVTLMNRNPNGGVSRLLGGHERERQASSLASEASPIEEIPPGEWSEKRTVLLTEAVIKRMVLLATADGL